MWLILALLPSVYADEPTAPTEAATPAAAWTVTAESFGCLQSWPAVGNTRVLNVAGQQAVAEAVARGDQPGPFPPGTVVQLMPTEAMVKGEPGSNPATDDWEYLKLKLKGARVEIAERGGAELRNIAGGCHDCHKTEPKWDHVCAAGHGCDPLPDFIVKAALKAVAKDPRCKVPTR